VTQSVLLPENSVSIIQGTSKTLQVCVVDIHGKPVDLTGGQAFLTVKRIIQDPAPLIQKSTRNPAQSIITVPRHGIVQFYFGPSDTQTLDPVDYVFDVWVILASGSRYSVVPPSVFQIIEGVTIIPP
jgi:hypothetical protein